MPRSTDPGSAPATDSAPTVREARQLCNQSELALVTKSRARGGMSAADAGKALARARKLRDKFRDLAASQRRRGRGKGAGSGGASADGNARTFRKAELFADVVSRFEAKLAATSTADSPVGKAKKAARAGKVARKAKKDASPKASRPTRQRVRRALAADMEAETASVAKLGAGKGVKAKRAAGGGEKASKKSAKKAPQTTAQKAAQRPAAKAAKSAGKKAAKTVAKRESRKPSRMVEGLPIATPVTAFAAAGFDATLSGVAGRVAKVDRRGKRVSAKIRETNAPKIRGHVSASGRRAQARRDSR